MVGQKDSEDFASKCVATRRDVTMKMRTSRWEFLPGRQGAATGLAWDGKSGP